jgi:Ras-related protein Rab-22
MQGQGPKVPGCKVVLVGESGVGKTCIISRYISGSYNDNCPTTNGASYCSKNVRYENLGKNLLLDVWDTAGQERYKSLTKFFYKDAAVAILVYDITRKETFNSLKNYWYSQVKENARDNIVLGIAGNKCDLYEKEEVSEAEAREFAANIGAIFKLTSAQNNTGINELFHDAGNKYLDPNFQQKLKSEEEEKGQNEQGNNVKLDTNEVKETNKVKKKKGGFC